MYHNHNPTPLHYRKPGLELLKGGRRVGESSPSASLTLIEGNGEDVHRDMAAMIRVINARLGGMSIDIIGRAVLGNVVNDMESLDTVLSWTRGVVFPKETHQQRIKILYDATRRITAQFPNGVATAFWLHGAEIFEVPPIEVLSSSRNFGAARRMIMRMAVEFMQDPKEAQG